MAGDAKRNNSGLPTVELLPSDADSDAAELAREIIAILEEKSAAKILGMNLEKVNPYFCIFIIASASSMVQLKTLGREVQKRLGHRLRAKGLRTEDIESGWLILDFADVILHLFLPEQRSFYNLERLWGDAPVVYRSRDLAAESKAGNQ